MGLIRDTEHTEGMILLWRIERDRFSIRPQALGGILPHKGGEPFICPGVCSGQIKKHYLSALFASVVKEYFFWLLCFTKHFLQKIGDPGCGVCSDLLLLLAQDMK
jgi:hypothetical protein